MVETGADEAMEDAVEVDWRGATEEGAGLEFEPATVTDCCCS